MQKTFLRVMFLMLIAFLGGYYVGQSKPTVVLAQGPRTLSAPKSWGTLKNFNGQDIVPEAWFEDANGTARAVRWQGGQPEVRTVLTRQ